MQTFKEFLELKENTVDWWSGMTGIAQQSPNQSAFYDMMTLRDRRNVLDQQYQQNNLQSREQEYEKLVTNLAAKLKSRGYEVKVEGWIHIQMPTNTSWGANWGQGLGVGAHANVQAFKTYRTFIPSAQNRITNYLQALEGFADILKQVQESDPRYPDRMQFKFPRELKMLFKHPDSLVVHWRNKYNRKRVEQAIDQYFPTKGVTFSDRGARATAGFDVDSTGDIEGGSHSQLISRALEKFIADHPQIKQANQQQAQMALQQWLAYFNKLNPDQLLQYLQQPS